MLELNVVNKIDDKVLITEHQKSNPNAQTRYYLVKEEKADKFISAKNSLNFGDSFQKVASIILSGLTAFYVGTKVNSNAVVKTLAGLAAGVGVYAGAKKFDDVVGSNSEKNAMKHLEVEEITGDEEKIANAMKTNSTDNEEISE